MRCHWSLHQELPQLPHVNHLYLFAEIYCLYVVLLPFLKLIILSIILYNAHKVILHNALFAISIPVLCQYEIPSELSYFCERITIHVTLADMIYDIDCL